MSRPGSGPPRAGAAAVLAAVLLLAGCATPRPPSGFLRSVADHPETSAYIPGVKPFARTGRYADAAPLASVFRFWGRPVSLRWIEQECMTTAPHVDPYAQLVRGAWAQGLWGAAFSGSLDLLKARVRAGVPVIVALQAGRFDPSSRMPVIVTGYSEPADALLCLAGNKRPQVISARDFVTRWRPLAFWMLVLCPPGHSAGALTGEELAGRGRFHESLGDPAKAAADFRAAADAGHDPAQMLVNLGNAHRALGDAARAEEAYRSAIAADEHLAQAYNNLAYLLIENGRAPEESVALARQALVLQPASPFALDTLGYALYLQGSYQEASDVLERARARSMWLPTATQTEIALHLVRAHLKNGQRHLARQVLAEAREADPKFRVPEDLGELLHSK